MPGGNCTVRKNPWLNGSTEVSVEEGLTAEKELSGSPKKGTVQRRKGKSQGPKRKELLSRKAGV